LGRRTVDKNDRDLPGAHGELNRSSQHPF